MERKCNKCGKVKIIDQFPIRKSRTGNIGYRFECKECTKKAMQKYCPGKPLIKRSCIHCGKEFETKLSTQFKCNKKCKPINERKEYLKALTIEERIIEKKQYYKQWYESNKEHCKEMAKKESYKERSRKYKSEHMIEHRKRKNIYKRNRIARDIDYRLKNHCRLIVYNAIKGNKLYKHSIDLLGCSVIDARKHIERQFSHGMTWDNWGVFGWHIDHIRPIASFDFTKKEDQFACFNYTNLQPLWWLDNVKKSNKIIEKQLILI